MLSLPSIVKKRNNPNHKYYTYDKLNRNCIKKTHATPLLILLNLKGKKKIETEELFIPPQENIAEG